MHIEVLPKHKQGARPQAGRGAARPAVVGKDGALRRTRSCVQVQFEVDVNLFPVWMLAIERHRSVLEQFLDRHDTGGADEPEGEDDWYRP